MARKAVKASKEAGAGGGTTIIGKGTASRELTHFLGIPLEPEKEIILILATNDKIDNILQAVISTAKLDKPGHGIAFIIVGINRCGNPSSACPQKHPVGVREEYNGK